MDHELEQALAVVAKHLGRTGVTAVPGRAFYIVPDEVWENDHFWDEGYHYGVDKVWTA